MHASQPPACNCLALRQASRHVTAFYDAQMARFGLRTTQFSILSRLAASGPWSIQALAKRMVLDRTTLGRNIQPLAREGLLTIGPDPVDRRSRALTITAAGRSRVIEARPAWDAAQRQFEALYGPDRAAGLRADLQQVSAIDFNLPERNQADA